MTSRSITITASIVLLAGAVSSPAFAKDAPVELARCSESLGTIAVVEGDTQGWSKYGLGSPRELIAALAAESRCFTMHRADDTTPATFLVNVIAGDAEEVDQGLSVAKGLATEGLVRSGAAGQLLSKVPMGGALLGAFGGLGGKKKTVAAGIRVIAPGTGITVASGSGTVKKSTLNFGGTAGAWQQGAAAAGYAGSKDGKMLTEAFIIAFNGIAAQQANIRAAAVPVAAAASPPVASATITVATDTALLAEPRADAPSVRSLRAGTELKMTGQRQGLFAEAVDNYGTRGWVSVESLQ